MSQVDIPDKTPQTFMGFWVFLSLEPLRMRQSEFVKLLLHPLKGWCSDHCESGRPFGMRFELNEVELKYK